MSEYKVGDKVSYGGKMYYVRKVKDGELWIRNASHTPVTKIHPDKVSIWQKKEKPTSQLRGTCQICGGNYGTKMGNIAHHGYRRPGGWQTASCEGAKHLPYEKSRDVLGDHIKGLHQSHAFHSEKVEHHQKDHGEPIDKLERYTDSYGNKAQKMVTYHPDHPMYARHKKDVLDYHRGKVRIYANAIEHQTKRYNDWKKLNEESFMKKKSDYYTLLKRIDENVVRDDDRAMKLLKYLNKRRKRNSNSKLVDIAYKDLSGKALLDHYSDRTIFPPGDPKEIPIHKIVPGQSGTRWSASDEIIKSKLKDKKPILAVKHPYEDRYIIYNGHHRFDAHRVKGEKTIKAHIGRIDEKKRTNDQILDFVKKLNKRSERNGVKHSLGHGSDFKFSHKYRSWPKKKEPEDIYDYDLASGIKKAKQGKPRQVSLKDIIHTQPGVGFHAPEETIKQKISDDRPVEIIRHKGKKYLWDGHHRDFVARLRGKKTVKAYIADTSKLDKF